MNLNIGPTLIAVNLWPSSSKSKGEDAALRPAAVVDRAHFVKTARVLEHGEIEVDRLFGVRVEPEKRRNARKVLECTHGNHLAS